MTAILSFIAALLAGTDSARIVCIGGVPFDRLAASYPLIFEADVIEEPSEVVLKSERLPNGRTVQWLGLRVRARVHKVWSGAPGASIEFVYTHHAQNIHGIFEKGDRFIVWAEWRDGRWQTNDCAPTIERNRASAEMLEFLGRLKK